MINPRFPVRLVVLVALALGTMPAWGASKEIIQLQTQMQQLQDQMARMQQTFDERMGVMKNLIEHHELAGRAGEATGGVGGACGPDFRTDPGA